MSRNTHPEIYLSQKKNCIACQCIWQDTFCSFMRNVIFKSCFLLSEYDSVGLNKRVWYFICACRQLGVIRDKQLQAISAAEVARGKNTSFVVLAQECFCLFCVYPEWPLKYPMVLCSLRVSELAYWAGNNHRVWWPSREQSSLSPMQAMLQLAPNKQCRHQIIDLKTKFSFQQDKKF